MALTRRAGNRTRPHHSAGTWGVARAAARAIHLLRTERVLIPLVLLALALRLWLIGAQSVWYDEALSIETAHLDLVALIQRQAQSVHPALSYLLLHVWFGLVGAGVPQARVLSVLYSVATVPVLHNLGEYLFDRLTANVAAFLLAISPIAIWYAGSTRMYALTGLLALLATRFLVGAGQPGGRGYWPAYAICASLALCADYSGAYLFCAANAAYLGAVAFGIRPLRPWLVGTAAVVALCVPVALMLRTQMTPANLKQLDWLAPPNPQGVVDALRDLIGQNAPQGAFVVLIGCTLGWWGILALVEDLRSADRRSAAVLIAMMLLLPLAMPLLLSVVRPTFITRTAQLALFGLLLLFGRGLALSLRWWPPAAGIAFVAVSALSASALVQVATARINPDWTRAAPYVFVHTPPGPSLVIFDQPTGKPAFEVAAGPLPPRFGEIALWDLASSSHRTGPPEGYTSVWLVTDRVGVPDAKPDAWYLLPPQHRVPGPSLARAAGTNGPARILQCDRLSLRIPATAAANATGPFACRPLSLEGAVSR